MWAIWVGPGAPASTAPACTRKLETPSFSRGQRGYGEAEVALRRGFRALDRGAGGRAAARQGFQSAARLGEPRRGDRELGKVGPARIALGNYSDPAAPPEARSLSCGGAARGLA